MNEVQLAFRLSLVSTRDINQKQNSMNAQVSTLVETLGFVPGTEVYFRPKERYVDYRKLGVHEPTTRPGRVYL